MTHKCDGPAKVRAICRDTLLASGRIVDCRVYRRSNFCYNEALMGREELSSQSGWPA